MKRLREEKSSIYTLGCGTFWFILSDDRDRLTRVLQGNGSLLMTGIAEVNTIDLERGEDAITWDGKTIILGTKWVREWSSWTRLESIQLLPKSTELSSGRGAVQTLAQASLTDRIWSPFRSSPLRSAGPPARMKEMKMPSPSSPPTMLKPRPVEPRWITIRLGSRGMSSSPSRSLATGE